MQQSSFQESDSHSAGQKLLRLLGTRAHESPLRGPVYHYVTHRLFTSRSCDPPVQPKAGELPLVCDCLLGIFAAALNTLRPSPQSAG
jgi:hypothetical protein